MFDANAVAYRFKGLFGESFEIVGVLALTVPVTTFSADLEFLEKDNYPLINEILLKLVSSGFGSSTEIAELLGVDFKIVSGAVLEEEAKGNLYISYSDEKLSISPLGQSVLASLDEKPRVKEKTTWHQDLVTGVFHQGGGLRVGIYKNLGALKKEAFDDSAVIETISISPENASFQFDELAFTKAEVKQALDNTQKKKEFCSQVLKVYDYKGKPQMKLGFLILFHDTIGDEKRAATVVDGEVHDEHLRALEESGEIQRLFERIQKVGPSEQPDETASSFLQFALDFGLPTLDETLLQNALTEENLEPQLFFDSKPLRFVFVEDLGKFVPEALEKTKKRLLVISPFLSSSVVNKKFISRLRDLDKRGVQIDIGIGIGDAFKDNELYSVDLLKQFAESSQNARVYHWKSHEKVLLADHYLSTGSFNWLSFGGVNERHFRRENSICISGNASVEPFYEHYRNQLEREAIEVWGNRS